MAVSGTPALDNDYTTDEGSHVLDDEVKLYTKTWKVSRFSRNSIIWRACLLAGQASRRQGGALWLDALAKEMFIQMSLESWHYSCIGVASEVLELGMSVRKAADCCCLFEQPKDPVNAKLVFIHGFSDHCTWWLLWLIITSDLDPTLVLWSLSGLSTCLLFSS